ncbi:hypothetical protein [Bosea sp. FBZP-16]|uniref:hypothetical protein n=1 Tax=Bosea sp. FBZP-16 TaxID=2065382 RepID=UPI00131A33FC|nr:hypothetical protein [Bosea sp. FBZP-16]
MKMIGVAVLTALLSGCASPQLETRDQWLAESQRTYADRDPEQVIRAAEAVLTSADPGDVTFAHTNEGFTATRVWSVYMVLAAVAGTDTFEFKATPSPQGTHTSLRVHQKARGSDGNAAEGAVSMTATYRLFYNWLDYALGKGDEWITCDQAEAKLKIANAGLANGLCAPGITSRGANPVQPREEWSKPSRLAPARPVSSRDQLKHRRP